MAEPTASESGRLSSRSVGDRIIKGGVLVAAATVVLKLAGLSWRVVLGWVFGDVQFRPLTGSHFFALGIVFMVFSVMDQTVAPAFLPVFSEQKNKRGERAAWRFASAVVLGVLVITGVAAALAFVFPGAWTSFSEFIANKEAPRDSSELLSLQVSYVAFAFVAISVSVVTYKILNAYKKFFWAQAGQGGMRIVMIGVTIGVVAVGLTQQACARALGIGVAAGSGVWVLIHLLALGRGLTAFGRPEFRSDAMRKFLMLAAPLLVGSIIAQVRDLVNYYAVLFPLGGLVSATGFGRAIPAGLDSLIPYSLSIAMFPYFCDLVDRNDLTRLGTILTRSGRVLVLGFSALAGAVAVMSLPFTMALYAKLDTDTVRLAALACACYVVVLPALAVEKFLMVGFFSNRRTITPVVLGAVFSFLSIGISVAGVRFLHFTGAQALATVALGYVAARYLKVLALAAALRRTVPIFPAAETAVFLVRAATVAAVCAGSALLVRFGYEAWWPLDTALGGGARARILFALPEIAAAGVVSVSAGLAAIKLLRMDELGWVLDWIGRRRRGEAPGGVGTPGASE